MAVIYGRPQSEKELLKLYPRNVKEISDIDPAYNNLKQDLAKTDGKFALFKRWNKRRQINRFRKNKRNKFHAGASGEVDVLNKLKLLDDGHHVLCGLNIRLRDWEWYGNKKNLRSAQMDFVVVSNKGVFLIEAKNWSTAYYHRRIKFTPHEQADRAGIVLKISLRSSWFSPRRPPVTSILVPTQENMDHEDSFGNIVVMYLSGLNNFIEREEQIFSEKDVKRIVNRLKGHVTSR